MEKNIRNQLGQFIRIAQASKTQHFARLKIAMSKMLKSNLWYRIVCAEEYFNLDRPDGLRDYCYDEEFSNLFVKTSTWWWIPLWFGQNSTHGVRLMWCSLKLKWPIWLSKYTGEQICYGVSGKNYSGQKVFSIFLYESKKF